MRWKTCFGEIGLAEGQASAASPDFRTKTDLINETADTSGPL